jgi:hypothetical protein
MHRSILSIFTVGASMVLILSVPGFSQTPQRPQDPDANNRDITMQRYAVTGKKSTFGRYYSLNMDCSPSPWFDIKIIKLPENGDANLVETATEANYTEPNPRVKCNGRSIKSTALEYSPKSGYTGPDSVGVELITEEGTRSIYTYNIIVK